jgi:hypothetical protein
MEVTVGKNPGPESAVALEPGFGAGTQSGIHPVARATFFNARKPNTLKLEFLPDEFVKVEMPCKDIAPGGTGLRVGQIQLLAQRLQDFHGEERDLAFIPGFVVEKAVPAQTPIDNTLQFVHLDDLMIPGRLFMMSEIVVAWGDEQVLHARGVAGRCHGWEYSGKAHEDEGERPGVRGATTGRKKKNTR